MHKAVKSTLAVVASSAILASVAVSPAFVSAWGDNGGGRPSYTEAQINSGVLGNKVVLNSISDGVIGNEKNFVGARLNTGINAGADNKWEGNQIKVEDGKEYIVRLYVHNNNPYKENASTGTRVAFDIPEKTVSARKLEINGYIFSDNATPSEYWDNVEFVADQAFHLEYIDGSALIENNGYASKINGGGKKLSDNIVYKAKSENGVAIGYEKEGDGIIPGCYNFAEYITIRVKAVYDNDYLIEQKVRLAGTKDWAYTTAAEVGDTVEFQVQYKNTNANGEIQRNVMIKSILPKNLEYIAGSTKLYNYNHSSGATVNQDTLVTTGINIGDYQQDANAYVRFSAKVVDKSLQCGSNTLVNWVQGGVGQRTIQDYATVTLNKVCPNTVTELPDTGPVAVTGGAIAAGSVVTAAGYAISSRRNRR